MTKSIPLFKVLMSDEVDSELLKVLHSGFIGEGQKVKDFEELVCVAYGLPRILATNSCTSALQLALRLSNVGHGDVVLSTPATNMATNSAILAAGATPFWVDIDQNTGRVDPYKLMYLDIPKKTKALMVMDWGGVPCDLYELYAFTQSRGIKLIVDAAQSFGATYHDRHLGHDADFTCHSLGPIKTCTSVDGGFLICKDADDHERGRRLRWFGIDRNLPVDKLDPRCSANIGEYGMKWHMTDVNATIGIANFKILPSALERARSNAEFYDKQLSLLSQLNSNIRPMHIFGGGHWWGSPTYWLYTIRVLKNRDEFAKGLIENGIACSKVHSRNDRHSCMPMTKDGDLPGVDEFYRTQICIPVGWWVSTEERNYIVDAISKLSDLAK